MSYKRLTKKDWHEAKFSRLSKNEPSDREILKKLWDLENKIEQGTLIELPCKVGAIVWAIDISTAQNEAIMCKVTNFSAIDEDGVGLMEYAPIDRVDDVVSCGGPITEIGISVFFTKAEAEAKLRELRGEV